MSTTAYQVTVPCPKCDNGIDVEVTDSGRGRDREVYVDYDITCDTCPSLTIAQRNAVERAALERHEQNRDAYLRYGRDDG